MVIERGGGVGGAFRNLQDELQIRTNQSDEPDRDTGMNKRREGWRDGAVGFGLQQTMRQDVRVREPAGISFYLNTHTITAVTPTLQDQVRLLKWCL